MQPPAIAGVGRTAGTPSGGMSANDDAGGDDDDGDDDSDLLDLQSVARRLTAGEEVPEAQLVATRARPRRTQAQLKAAIMSRRLMQDAAPGAAASGASGAPAVPASPASKGGLAGKLVAARRAAPSPPAAPAAAHLGRQPRAPEAKDGVVNDDDNDGEDIEEDDLDWEALGQFEQYEAWQQQQRQQALSQANSAHRRAAGAAPAAGRSAAVPAIRASSAAAPRSGSAAVPRVASKEAARLPNAAGDAQAAATGGQRRGGAAQRRPASAAAGVVGGSPAAGPAAPVGASSSLDRELDEVEALLLLLEAGDDGEGAAQASSGAQRGRDGGGSKVAGASAGADPDDGVDWGAVEKLLLGDNWERELLEELTAVDGDGAAAGLSVEGGGEVDKLEPWADEVTTLLLGLVGMSHQKYLGRSLLDVPVSEDERASVFWNADFMLLVADDSRDALLEYSNAAASRALGRDYLDLFGTPSHSLVAADEAAQAEWAFALREVEDNYTRFTVVPRLMLNGAGGRRLLARDVLLWRVDSLEDTLVGTAILVRKWEFQQ